MKDPQRKICLAKKTELLCRWENTISIPASFFLLAFVPLPISLLVAPLNFIRIPAIIISFIFGALLFVLPYIFAWRKDCETSGNLSVANIFLTLANCFAVGFCCLGAFLIARTSANIFIMLIYAGFSLFAGLLGGIFMKLKLPFVAFILLSFLPFAMYFGTLPISFLLVGESETIYFIILAIIAVFQLVLGLFYLMDYEQTISEDDIIMPTFMGTHILSVIITVLEGL